MKILLDECVNQRLAQDFIGHEVSTVSQMGWLEIKGQWRIAGSRSQSF